MRRRCAGEQCRGTRQRKDLQGLGTGVLLATVRTLSWNLQGKKELICFSSRMTARLSLAFAREKILVRVNMMD